MKLSGKTKEEFEKWFIKDYDEEFDNLDLLSKLPLSMQIGVLQLYFDSVGIECEVFQEALGDMFIALVNEEWDDECKERQQAWTQAVIKANEIREEQLVNITPKSNN